MCKLKRRRKTLELLFNSRTKSYCFIYFIEDARFGLPLSKRGSYETFFSPQESPQNSFLSVGPPIQNLEIVLQKYKYPQYGLFGFTLRGSSQRLV